jgi:hypothetical protein
MRQRVGQGFFGVGERLDRPQAEGPDEVGVGDFDFETRFAVIQSNPHVRLVSRSIRPRYG